MRARRPGFLLSLQAARRPAQSGGPPSTPPRRASVSRWSRPAGGHPAASST